ncbi:hypothetical protein [Paenibacillus pinihumi]|uniref:hypothetical protein n=1 Tax=Paenibacillus pinihumi TaxID=669462 RepID=UPI0004020507|nr:hypothetical protein [Paenibacillus pinihumi]
MRYSLGYAALCLLLLLLTGCSTTHTVRTAGTKTLSQELRENWPDIRKVSFSFTRPNLYCTIQMENEPTADELTAMLDHIRGFATIEHMDHITSSVGWSGRVSEFHLRIKAPEKELGYYSQYFKTYDASNYSPENIEAYQIWHDDYTPPASQ